MLYNNNKKIGISLTCYKRADYLETVLDSLQQSLEFCKIDISKSKLYVSIDYFDNVIPSIIKNIDWINTKYVINNPSIGCNANTRQAMLMSLEENNATIHLEDDTVLSKDAISFFIEYLEKYHDDKEIISISGYNKTNNLDNISLSTTIKQKHFTCWGCAFWKHKFKIFEENWTPHCNRGNNSSSWDTHLDESVFQNESMNFYQVKPEVSRIQNIGAIDGTWVPSEDFHTNNHRSPYTSDDLLPK